MAVNIQVINCLPPEYLITVQMGYVGENQQIKSLKGEDKNLMATSPGVEPIPKHAIISHDFDLSKRRENSSPLQILIAWPKERKFVQWNFNKAAYSDEETQKIYAHYVSQDGIYFSGGGTQKIKFMEWAKLKKMEEVRGSSNKLIMVECIPMED